MKKEKFKIRTFPETLYLLCKLKGEPFIQTRGGKEIINQTHIAKIAGTTQANVSRWLTGTHDFKVGNASSLANAFGVTVSQLIGESPINRLDSDMGTAEDKEFFELYAKMPDAIKKLVRDNAQNTAKAFEQKPES